jgi:hypothetical protein
MRAKRRVPAPRCSHPAVWTPFADAARVYRCPRRPIGPSCTHNHRESGECRIKAHLRVGREMHGFHGDDIWVPWNVVGQHQDRRLAVAQ